MIVNSTPAGWQIIYQQAHALLAAQLAWHWPPTLPPDRWVGLLAAIAQHDDEQAAWHGHGGHHGLTPAGAPANFTQKEFSLEQAVGVLAAARFQGRWRSLLTSLHLSCLYEGLRGQKKEIDGFLDDLKARQQQWQKELKISRKEAAQAYALLHWCDRLSLILCRHEIPEMGRAVEIHRGPDGTTHTLAQPGGPGGPVIIRPWPFQAPKVEVSVEASVLTQLQFKDDAELAAALRAAPVEPLTWTLARAV
ncbi:DUF3891 family protein [Microvirga sp. STS02]|uniref:DUF3891 family protein n=1 Tax=Hymenobacter negativus TaxID=2795026 RepID=UPI0018DB8C96|nr:MULTISPECIES: DUF3891 family protein [Bacteria]MBH8570641.1 DUF3891 family protein [Hymenobacter negativus]MBR7210379.1 DUF3891 family protein [Microvirga sp. STS02]